MADYVYVLEKRLPKKENGATVLRVQNGPRREDNKRKTEFVNQLLIRCPSHINLDRIEVGEFINIVYEAQGVATRKDDGSIYYTPELVAKSVKPAQDWQKGIESDLYPAAQ